jgi:hypothetical protein
MGAEYLAGETRCQEPFISALLRVVQRQAASMRFS